MPTSIVLLSGGLDSAVLLAEEAERAQVQPVYVSVGLAWEVAEQAMLERLLSAPVFAGRTLPLARIEFGMRDVYPATHWAIRGAPPAYDTPDVDVYLPGRNLVLLTKAGVLAALIKSPRIVLGTLADNPFPDATSEFFAAMARALSLGLHHQLEIEAPLASFEKAEVIKRGVQRGVPLDRTLSCMNPQRDVTPAHCGRCSKCRERRQAFAAAGVTDRTHYAAPSPR